MKVLVVLFPFLVNVFLVRAPVVLGIFVLVDNLLPFVLGGGSVAYGAHLGGFVAGLLVAWAVGRRHAVEAWDAPAVAHLAAGEALLRQGQPSAAFQHLLRALELARDEQARSRAKAVLARLPLDPRLRLRLGCEPGPGFQPGCREQGTPLRSVGDPGGTVERQGATAPSICPR
ncbi:MAG: rhomboid family intramembrane serine protease [Myxococcota bacterium]